MTMRPDEAQQAARQLAAKWGWTSGRALDESDADRIVASIFTAEATEEMFTRLSPVLREIIRREGKLAVELVDGTFETFRPERIIDDYLRVGENRIKGIGKTTAGNVRGALRAGIREGEGARGLRNRVSGVFRDAETWRAQAIARTESVGANNFARVRGYEQAGAGAKEWLATMDGNVRDTHAAVNAVIVPVNDVWEVGNSLLEYPGDPNGDAEEVVNCRCTSLPAKLSDAQGQFVGTSMVTDAARRERLWRQFAVDVERWEPQIRRQVRQLHRRWRQLVLTLVAATAEVPTG